MYSYVIDDLENAIDYLEQAAFFYSCAEYKHRLKWLTISLHGALYGFGVAAVKGSNPTATVFKPINKVINKASRLTQYREEISQRFEETEPEYIDMYLQRTEGKLLSIYDILDKCKNEELMRRYTDSKVLKIDELTEASIKEIVELRNDFSHFTPKSVISFDDHSIDIKRVFKVIRFLSLDCNNILYYPITNKERVERVFDQLDFSQYK